MVNTALVLCAAPKRLGEHEPSWQLCHMEWVARGRNQEKRIDAVTRGSEPREAGRLRVQSPTAPPRLGSKAASRMPPVTPTGALKRNAAEHWTSHPCRDGRDRTLAGLSGVHGACAEAHTTGGRWRWPSAQSFTQCHELLTRQVGVRILDEALSREGAFQQARIHGAGRGGSGQLKAVNEVESGHITQARSCVLLLKAAID
eukprot:scaffold262494_cov26-Tisochrysis_lutea.AAC.3